MTAREAYDFFLHRFILRLAATSAVVFTGWAVARLVHFPLTALGRALAAIGIIVLLTVGVRYIGRSLRPLGRRLVVGSGIAVVSISLIVLFHEGARALSIDSAVPNCAPNSDTCEIAVKGRVREHDLALHEAVLVLFRSTADKSKWTIGDVAVPYALSGERVWTGALQVNAGKGQQYEILGIVGKNSAHRGDQIDAATFGDRFEPRRIVLTESIVPESAGASCCAGVLCTQKPEQCASAWERVPCDAELHDPKWQWRLRLGAIRTESGQPFSSPDEEMEICIRAGSELQCATFPGASRTFPSPFTTAALENSAFTVSVETKALKTKRRTHFARGQHHRVLVGPEAVCNGILIPLGEDHSDAVSIFLDADPATLGKSP